MAMQVIKRSGKNEDVSFDKITARVKKLCYGLSQAYVEPIEIAKKVIQGLYDGVPTTELDNLAAETAAVFDKSKFRLLEVDPHALGSAMMGKTAPFMVIETDIESSGIPSKRVRMS